MTLHFCAGLPSLCAVLAAAGIMDNLEQRHTRLQRQIGYYSTRNPMITVVVPATAMLLDTIRSSKMARADTLMVAAAEQFFILILLNCCTSSITVLLHTTGEI